MLTTKHLEDYILKKENGEEIVELGGNHGHRYLNEDLLGKPNVCLDLNEGYHKWIEDTEDRTKLDVFLKWMIEKSPEGNIEKVLNGAKFVCRRGVLTRMAQGEYLQSKGDWQVLCVRRGGAIYLQEEKSQKDIQRKAQASDREKASWYWGHRFEKYMVLNPWCAGDRKTTHPTKDRLNADIRMVMSATLKSFPGIIKPATVQVLYSGEIDAIDSAGHYVEMKTAKSQNHGFGYWFWKEKSLSWWLQSRLVDVDYLVVGNRDNHGTVHKLTKMKLSELESSEWNSKNCLHFLLRALVYIDENLKEGEAARLTSTGGHLGVQKVSPGDAPILTKAFVEHFKI